MLNKSSEKTFDELIRLRTNRHSDGENQRVDPGDVINKVIEDINFLRGRIAHIERSAISSQNPTILTTYESMLKSRESVLHWLQEETGASTFSQNFTQKKSHVN